MSLCAAMFSCTTVRTPVSTIAPTVDLRGAPAPELELWVESNRDLSPAEAERYRADARRAIEAALAGRSQPDDGSLVLLREQGVTRTKGHRSDQTAATAGIVVGAVAVVAAATLVALSVGGGKGGSHVSHSAPAPGSRPVAAPAARTVPGARPAVIPGGAVAARPAPRFAPPPRPPIVPARFPPPGARPPVATPSPRRAWEPSPSIAVDFGFYFPIPLDPEPLPPYPYVPFVPPPPPEFGPPLAWPVAADAVGTNAAPPAPEEGPSEIVLPRPAPYPVASRSFFDCDRLVLEAIVLDRATGEALWTKRVSRDADPRDALAVKQVVDELLAEDGWMPFAPPGSGPDPVEGRAW